MRPGQALREVDNGIYCLLSSVAYLDHPDHWRDMECFSWADWPVKESLITKVNERLVLMVDLSYSSADIEREFGSFLRKWKPPKTGKVRQGTSQIDDIWKIYEGHTIEKRNFTAITIDHLHLDRGDRPKDKKEWPAAYQAVKRAHKKALSILKEVEVQAEKRSR